MSLLWMALLSVRNVFRNRGELAFENLALRQQLAVFHSKKKRPRIRQMDRIFWVWLSRLWSNWRSALLIVKPDTVVRWHKQGFKLYWRWKSQAIPGRPKVEIEIRKLIRRMCHENPSWGAPRIHSELCLLGYDVSETTVDNYLIRCASRLIRTPCQQGTYELTSNSLNIRYQPVNSMDGACHELATDGIVVCEKHLSQSRRTRPRESCAATATCRIPFQKETAQNPTNGPRLLGFAIEIVVELAFSPPCRQT